MRFRAGAFVCRLTLGLAVCLAAVNLLAIALRFPLLAAVPLGVVAYRRLTRWETSDAYGSARASGVADLWQHGLLGEDGLIMGSCGFIDPPGKAEGLRALFVPSLPSTLACRLFLAAFFGKPWMEP
jgi:hypothetical protein